MEEELEVHTERQRCTRQAESASVVRVLNPMNLFSWEITRTYNTCTTRNTRTRLDPFMNTQNEGDEKYKRGAGMKEEPRAKSL